MIFMSIQYVKNKLMRLGYIFAFILLAIGVKGQKLPIVQTTSVWAPNNLRIDGKELEWGDSFAAENKRTEIYYTMANDDKSIYLAIKSVSKLAVAKIMAGAISFTIHPKGRKKESGYTITYPIVNRNRNVGGGQARQRGVQNRSNQTQQQRDSLQLVQRKTQLATVKEIKQQGFTNINDSLISIYNEYGIKAAASFDNEGNIFIEYAIPFYMLNIVYNDVKEIAYQIKLNGRGAGVNGVAVRNNMGTGQGRGNNSGNSTVRSGNNQELMSVTDFWGKYVLHKK